MGRSEDRPGGESGRGGERWQAGQGWGERMLGEKWGARDGKGGRGRWRPLLAI